MKNVAGNTEMGETVKAMREKLTAWMTSTGDPRTVNEHDERWDKYEYYGDQPKQRQQ
jgi:hypothetical protein